MNKLDFKLPEHVTSWNGLVKFSTFIYASMVLIVPITTYFIIDTFNYDALTPIYNQLLGWVNALLEYLNLGDMRLEYFATLSFSNVYFSGYMIWTTILNTLIFLLPYVVIRAIFSRSHKQLSNKIGKRNEDENYAKINACTNISELIRLILNTDINFKLKETKDNVEHVVVLESNIAKKFIKDFDEKIKSTNAYKTFVENLENQDKKLDIVEIHGIYLMSDTARLPDTINDLTNRVIEQIKSRTNIDTYTLYALNKIPEFINETFHIDAYPKVKELASVLDQNNQRYINHTIEHDIEGLVFIYNDYADNKTAFTNLLNANIANVIKTQPDKLDTSNIMRWVMVSPFNKSVIGDIFNDDRYTDYPHKEILVHYINGDEQEAMYNVLRESQNKTAYDKVSSLFYTNVLIGLGLTQSVHSQNEDYKEYFDNLMTEGWSSLYLLELLDDNKKFTQDMGNEKKRDLKARIEDLKHKRAVLSEAEKTSQAADEQAQAAKNSEKYAQQQANYHQQQAEYQRIQAEQAAAQTQYQQQAAKNSAQALNASKNAQRDAKRAKENTDWMRN